MFSFFQYQQKWSMQTRLDPLAIFCLMNHTYHHIIQYLQNPAGLSGNIGWLSTLSHYLLWRPLLLLTYLISVSSSASVGIFLNLWTFIINQGCCMTLNQDYMSKSNCINFMCPGNILCFYWGILLKICSYSICHNLTVYHSRSY